MLLMLLGVLGPVLPSWFPSPSIRSDRSKANCPERCPQRMRKEPAMGSGHQDPLPDAALHLGVADMTSCCILRWCNEMIHHVFIVQCVLHFPFRASSKKRMRLFGEAVPLTGSPWALQSAPARSAPTGSDPSPFSMPKLASKCLNVEMSQAKSKCRSRRNSSKHATVGRKRRKAAPSAMVRRSVLARRAASGSSPCASCPSWASARREALTVSRCLWLLAARRPPTRSPTTQP